ncbi:MAG: ABC transporter permease [Candidatus Aminicenantales bacterium]|jgi:ABC-2 type transport system permease protein
MKKFTNLLFKEIRELINKQLIISLLMMMAIFYFIGQMAKTEMKKAAATQKISVMDLDQSELSRGLAGSLKTANFEIEWSQGKDPEAAVQAAKKSDAYLLLVIPQGFGESVARFEQKEITTYTFLRSFSIGGIRKSEILRAVITATNNYLSDNVLKRKVPDVSPDILKSPIKTKDYVIVKDRMAEGSASAISGFVYSQSIIIPIILFMIIMYSSQMVISAIAMEKQNKTLETLLTVPIPRTSIVTTKMLAAGIVGLLSAAIYMIGMKSYFGGITGDVRASAAMSGVIKQLGLTLSGKGYLLLGIALFFAILCGLAMATILGVLAEDFRSAQTLMLPLMLMILIPYLLSFFADVQSLPLPAKLLVLAIPFSHPFLATPNIMLGRYPAVIYGILYMAVVFLVLVFIAARIFSTDRVLTMKLRWGKKKVVL